MLSMRDKFGVWSEYFRGGKQAGTLYRTWETSVNLAALIENGDTNPNQERTDTAKSLFGITPDTITLEEAGVERLKKL